MPSISRLFNRAGLIGAGFVLSVPLHILWTVVAIFIVIALGLAPGDATWPEPTQQAFVISFGLWQWLYLAPLIWFLSRTRAAAMCWGFLLSGLLGMAFCALGLFAFLWNKLV